MVYGCFFGRSMTINLIGLDCQLQACFLKKSVARIISNVLYLNIGIDDFFVNEHNLSCITYYFVCLFKSNKIKSTTEIYSLQKQIHYKYFQEI